MNLPRYEKPVISRISQGAINKFGRRLHCAPVTSIEGTSVPELIARFGSPLFVFSEARLVGRYRDLLAAFQLRYPSVRLAWSYKTNSLGAICKIFHREGSMAEVVSPFELDRAARLGVPGREIIYNGPAKSVDSLRQALQMGAMVNLDNYDEIAAMEGICSGDRPTVGIRINMSVPSVPHWDRFGFNLENGQAMAAVERIHERGVLRLVCIHCHLGTFIQQPEAYEVAARKLVEFAGQVRERFGADIEHIDLGGGFASPNSLRANYLPGNDTVASFASYAEAIVRGLGSPAGNHRPCLILETGRALVDDAGYLLSTVVATRRLADGRRAIIADAGTNLLPTAAWYRHDIRPGMETAGNPEPTGIFGPLCMQIDALRNNLLFPSVGPGDPLVVLNAGAYNVTQWTQFTAPRPAVVLIRTDGTSEVIRRRESYEDLTAQEVLPNDLGE